MKDAADAQNRLKLGVLVGTEAMRMPALIAFAQRLESLGYESLWLPELFGREPTATAGFVLARTERLKVGTGIANIYVRDAHCMAATAETLAELSGGRFIVGLGVSNVGLNTSRGHQWQMPLPKMRSYLESMQNAALDVPAAQTKAPVYIAAHGPKLQTLGAERTDGIITYLMPPEHTAISRAHVGTDTTITVTCPFLFETDASVARTRARKALRYYMTLDYYHREWSKLGFGPADFADGGSDRLIDALVAWGDPEALQARVDAYRTAGADRIMVMPYDKLGATDSLTTLAPSQGHLEQA